MILDPLGSKPRNLTHPLPSSRRIVERPVTFPADPPVSDVARDIILSLCTVDRSRRLGNISGGAQRVKEHPFFLGVDWVALYERQSRGPIIPPVRFVGDARCFDIYPEDDVNPDAYTSELEQKYDEFFKDF